MKLSIIIPLFNEREYINNVICSCLQERVDGITRCEIIVVDDCSTDGSDEIVRDLAARHENVTVVTHHKNQGKGAAIRTGLFHVTGDAIIIQDADPEYSPSDYGTMLEPIVSSKADAVYGSRFQGSSQKRVLLFWHTVGNRILTTFSNMWTNLNLADMETGYKAFTSEVAHRLQIREHRFGFEPEITARLSAMGARIYEVGIQYHGRSYREGKKISWRDGVAGIWCIVKYGILCRCRTARPLPSLEDKTWRDDSRVVAQTGAALSMIEEPK